MLDGLFGFGKSKKSKDKSNGSSDDSPTEEFVVVNNYDPNKPPYPQTIMLNDELIRGTPSANPSSSIYPSLDPGAPNPNSKLPYSSTGGQKLKIQSCRNGSPIDNIPFSMNINGDNSVDYENKTDLEIVKTLSGVENYIEYAKYDFELENSILRESLE